MASASAASVKRSHELLNRKKGQRPKEQLTRNLLETTRMYQ